MHQTFEERLQSEHLTCRIGRPYAPAMRGPFKLTLPFVCALSVLATAPASAANRPYICTPKEVGGAVPPPPLRPVSSVRLQDPPKAPCPAGEVPVPTPWGGRKAMLPRRDSGLGPRVYTPPSTIHTALANQSYFFAGAEQTISTDGADALITEAAPRLYSTDALTLAELNVQSDDQDQSVIVGWVVDPDVNGDSAPHLFVYHWVNGAGTCFNGCGWKQVSTTRTPGMVVTTGADPESYAILHFSGNWWVWYQMEWIGYFPDSTWSSPAFTKAGFVQWLGQVAAASATTPASQMGNGIFGSAGGSTQFASLRTYPTGTAVTAVASSAGSTLASAYDVGMVDASNFRFGGPGFPPCTAQCTGLECGDNGCGGSCGTCGSGLTCSAGICVGGAGDTCATAILITPSGTQYRSGDTTHAGEDYSSSSCGGLGRDRVYSFTLTSPMVLDAEVSGFDTVLYLRSTCSSDASELVCNDDSSLATVSSAISASLDPGTYYLFVDGYADEQGSYDLSATFMPACMPESCTSVPGRCGVVSDGCTEMLHCGSCQLPQVCGAGGTPNVCGIADAGTPDAGPRDAGFPDAGPRDAGSPDAGAPDAGPRDAGFPDAGPRDAGAPDAGAPDAGNPDAGNPDVPDSGPLDAGTSTSPDAGRSTSGDAGNAVLVLPGKKSQTVPTGCGCTAMSGSASALQAALFGLMALRTRRRRRLV